MQIVQNPISHFHINEILVDVFVHPQCDIEFSVFVTGKRINENEQWTHFRFACIINVDIGRNNLMDMDVRKYVYFATKL